ncbi:zinc ribbon domain-containing protein [Meiothermus sp. CFH 77666]|nr:zinc ribbon domain-containing protein [Meiothermus sp. CFH 77666]
MEGEPGLFYHICPRCSRAVPAHSQEHYCLNDGERLLEACPRCGARFTSPYARFCGVCGLELSKVPEEKGGVGR